MEPQPHLASLRGNSDGSTATSRWHRWTVGSGSPPGAVWALWLLPRTAPTEVALIAETSA